MATGTMTIPPPPPGFTLDAPSGAIPPPPPGFTLDDATPQPASFADKAVGGWAGRTLLGMASPIIAGAQLFGGEDTRAKLAELEAMKQRGMAAEGKSGFDWYGLLGSAIPAAGIAKATTTALPAVTSTLGKVGLGAAQGGAVAAATPSSGVTAEEYFPNKAAQVGSGAVVGGAIPLVTAAGQKIYDIGKTLVEPFTESGRADILSRYQNKLIGEAPTAKQKVVDALMKAQELVPGSKPTAGEALAAIPEGTGLASHQRAVSKMEGISPPFVTRKAEQEAARRSVLVPIARNQGALEGEEAIRNTITGPMREQALLKANAGTARQLAQEVPPAVIPSDALKTAMELHGVPPKPLTTAAELNAHGVTDLTPLRADTITRSIRSTAAQPGLRASDVVTKTLGDLKEKIAGLANEQGIVDSRDLYMVRKEAGNLVKKYAEESKNFDQRLTSGLVSNIQKSIDDAIEAAGGKGWKSYLGKYQELSQPINRMKAGQELEKSLTSSLGTAERGTVFGNTIRSNPELMDALPQTDQKAVQAVAADLARQDAYKRLAQQTNFSGAKAIHEGIQFPNLLSRPAMIANYLTKHFSNEPTHEAIAKLAASQYLNPQALAGSLMRGSVPSRYQAIIEALTQQGPAMAASGIARQQ